MINYHFFGRECFIDKELKERDNVNLNLQKLNFSYSNILLLNQMHGNETIIIDDIKKIYGDQNLPKADGIVTNLPNIVIGIITADCAPVIFYDQNQNIIGACHAGWRGAKSGIIASTISAMKKIGAQDIFAVIGPTIQQYSYQVSHDFYQDFLDENINSKQFFKEDKLSQKWFFSLPNYIENKLNQSGVFDVINLEIDTYTNIKNYFSYRYSTHHQEELDGRNLSVIAINKSNH